MRRENFISTSNFFPQPTFPLLHNFKRGFLMVFWQVKKKGWKLSTPWFIISTSVIVTKKKYLKTLLPAFSHPELLLRQKKSFFLWKFNFLFLIFFSETLDEDLVRNVLIYGSRKSRLPYFFFMNSCSFSLWNKSLIYYLPFLMMHVFQFAFL